MFRKPLQETFRHALAHLENLDRMPAGAPANLGTLRSQLPKPLLDERMAAEQVVAEREGYCRRVARHGRGRRAMRVRVCNWQTSERDVKRAVDSVAEVLKVAKVRR